MYKILICLCLFVAADVVQSAATGAPTLPCTGEGYSTWGNGGCYKLYELWKSWDESNAHCIRDGAHLVIINDGQEAGAITARTHPIYVYDMHVGVFDEDGEGEWLSVKGEPVQQLYNLWFHGVMPAENEGRSCAIYISDRRKLDDRGCQHPRHFVCEKDLTVTTKTSP